MKINFGRTRKIRNRMLSFVMSLVMVLTVMTAGGGTVMAAGEFVGGTGTAETPWLIATVEQLNNVRNNLAAHYIMQNNIDLTAYLSQGGAGWNNGAGWEPIGTDLKPFTGTFNGNGHTIIGLYINRPHFIGLFTKLLDSSIKNLGLVNVYVTGSSYVGGLAGSNHGLNNAITNCYVTGTVTGTEYDVGGLVGYNIGNIVASSATANVTGTVDDVGGLVGSNHGNITASHATGNVTGRGNVGGLVGNNHGNITASHATGRVTSTVTVPGSETYGGSIGGLAGDNSYGNITDSYATGEVTNSDAVGGLVGENSDGNITNSYATGKVTGSSHIGGLVGSGQYGKITASYATGSVKGTMCVGGLEGSDIRGNIIASYATGKVTGSSYIGGLIGYSSGCNPTASYYNSQSTGQSDIGKGEPLNSTQMAQQSTFVGWDFNNTWNISEWSSYPYLRALTPASDSLPGLFLGGRGSAEDPFKVGAPYQLNNVRTHLNAHFILTEDIDLAAYLSASGAGYNDGSGWLPVGTDASPFTGVFEGNGHIINHLFINRPDQSRCGLFGKTNSAEIRDLGLTDVNISSSGMSGGLVGYNIGTITGCHVTGNVTGTGGNVGGLVGWNNGPVSDCYTGVAVTGTVRVGGLVGIMDTGAIENSHATGNVTGTGSSISGLVGENRCPIINSYATGNVASGTGNNVGGLVGMNTGSNAIVSYSYAAGAVSGGGNLGGLVGINASSITNSYALGAVNGNSDVGGLVGNQFAGGITNSYAKGAVKGNSLAGGLVGRLQGGTVASSYYNSGTTGQSDTGKGVPKTTAQMMQSSTFAVWDFTVVWTIAAGASYPYLRRNTPYPLPAPPALTGVTVTPEMLELTYGGDTAALAATSLPADALLTVTWTSSDKSVATVDVNGVVTPVGAGEATITATTTVGNFTDTATVTVNKKELTVGGTFTANNKQYDGTAAATINTNSLTLKGIVGTDAVNLNAAAAFADANMGVGKTVSLTVASSLGDAKAGNYTLSLAGAPTATAEVTKADGPAPPPAPKLLSKTHNSVTLVANPAHQFRIDGGDWQDSNVFTGLSASTTYTFTARVKETATHKASAESTGLNVTTDAPAGIASTLPTALTEAVANNGSLTSGTVVVTIANGTLAAGIAKADVTASNLPAGLDYTVSRTDDTNLSITITGNATSHANANDVSNLTFTIAQAKVIRAESDLTTVSISIDFNDLAVTYYANGGSGTAPAESNKAAGAIFTAAANSFTAPASKQFKHWNTAQDDTGTSYALGATVTMPAYDLNLYAIWEIVPPNTYTISIDTLTGGNITASPISATSGTAITLTVTPDAGKRLQAGTLKYNDGSNHAITGTSFTMPAANVTVTAVSKSRQAITPSASAP